MLYGLRLKLVGYNSLQNIPSAVIKQRWWEVTLYSWLFRRLLVKYTIYPVAITQYKVDNHIKELITCLHFLSYIWACSLCLPLFSETVMHNYALYQENYYRYTESHTVKKDPYLIIWVAINKILRHANRNQAYPV